MRRYVKELKPTEVRDLAAMVALFRPGPMANIPAYIRRKHGEEAVTYLHPSLEPALRDTYGIFVYQEDIMTAAIAMADYTGPEADNLCYAIRKKKEDVLRQHEAKFKAGAEAEGDLRRDRRPGLRRLRAVRALRVQQGARHLLRAHRLPDRVPEGELPDRVHDRGPQRLPRARREGGRGHRRVPATGDRGSRRRTSRSRTRPSPSRPMPAAPPRRFASAWRRSRTSARARSRRSRACGMPATSLARSSRSTTSAAVSTCARSTSAWPSRSSRRTRWPRSGRRARCSARLDGALENGQRHQRDVAAGQSTLFDLFAAPAEADRSGSWTAARRSRAGSGCAGRRSSSACTCRSTHSGDIADELPEYVTAYTGDLAEESRPGAR